MRESVGSMQLIGLGPAPGDSYASPGTIQKKPDASNSILTGVDSPKSVI
jgi:hypothetical protein